MNYSDRQTLRDFSDPLPPMVCFIMLLITVSYLSLKLVLGALGEMWSNQVDWWYIARLVTVVGGAIGGCFTIYVKFIRPVLIERVWYPVRRHLDAINQVAVLAQELPPMLPKLKQVCNIVLPNHGSSIPDGIGRIEAQLFQLIQSQARSSSIQDVLLTEHPRPTFVCSRAGNTFVNRRYAELLECEREDLLGKGWRTYVHLNDILEFDKAWSLAFNDQRDSFMTMRVIAKRTRRQLVFSVQLIVMRGSDGEPLDQFLGVMDVKEP